MGKEVIPTFVNFITQTRSIENPGTCDKVQIITHGYGAAEVLVTLSDFPTNSSSYISNVINLAPCAVATFLNEDADSKKNSKEHRMLANILDEEELLGDDQVLKEKESQGRRLAKNRNNYYERTKRFCDYYPSHCYSFCDTWHRQCPTFCSYFPEYCKPQQASSPYCTLRKAAMDNNIDSFYGPNWATQLDTLCSAPGVSSSQCKDLKSSSSKSELCLDYMFSMW